MGFERILFRIILAVVLIEPTGLVQDPDHKTGTHIISSFLFFQFRYWPSN